MSTPTETQVPAEYLRRQIFRRILVGIDGSPESLEAARQAAVLATAPVKLVSVYDQTIPLAGAGFAAGPVPYDENEDRRRAERALEDAQAEVHWPGVTTKVLKGRAWEQLHYEAAAHSSSLVALGSHEIGRAKGIVIGSTATELVHKAPCAVLLARRPLRDFPSSIVVGVDDSFQAATAGAIAADLAERFGATLERFENVSPPVTTLVDASMEADLLVVGSRRVQGVKALGSVSERVAHEARCSVLIVR